MKLCEVTPATAHLLEQFTAHQLSPHFRYFAKRAPAAAIKSHVYTLVGLIDDQPVAYGHIDYEENYWIGLCVLDAHQRKGYGRTILRALLARADMTHIPRLHLTVDADNAAAITLYQAAGFVIERTTSTGALLMTRTAPLTTTHAAITLPVSYGEALDKLSILDIKLQKITDSRRADVQVEYDAIYNQLLPLFTPDVRFHYTTLKAINLSIWDMQDTFRESKDNDEKNDLCTQIILDNDRRFRVKHKINHALNSSLKEQKGYARTKVCFVGHTEVGDMINCIGMVRFLATCYDEVRIPVKERHVRNMSLLYADDPSIKLFPFPSHIDIYKRCGMPKDILEIVGEGCEIAYAGANMQIIGQPAHDYSYIPFSFYADVGIAHETFWEYSHYAHNPASAALARKLTGIPYVFMHGSTSKGALFTADDIERRFGIDRNTTLIVNPDLNVYPPSHPWFRLAEEFVFKPVADYRETIIHAQKVIVSDSCFFCYSLHLPIETTECYYVMRDLLSVQDYDYIFSDLFGYDTAKPGPKRKFECISF